MALSLQWLTSLVVMGAVGVGATGCPSAHTPGLRSVPATATATCAGEAGAANAVTFCLAGTVDTSAFTTPIQEVDAVLYDVFPSGAASAISQQPVAKDGTWAFAGLPKGPHYFVQLLLVFPGGAAPVARTVGPFTTDQGGAAIAVQMKPVELDVLESAPVNGVLAVQWARAHVYDPGTGNEIVNTAKVAITIEDVTIPLPWDTNQKAYFKELSAPPFAQATLAQANYTLTIEDPSLGPAATSWKLAADSTLVDGLTTKPSVDGGATAAMGAGVLVAALITAPSLPADAGPEGGIDLPASSPLVVSWTPRSVDYVSVELFSFEGAGDAGSWQIVYPPAGTPPSAPEAGSLSTAGLLTLAKGGLYLLNVAYSNAACAATTDGCVLSGAIAAEEFTAE